MHDLLKSDTYKSKLLKVDRWSKYFCWNESPDSFVFQFLFAEVL